MKRRTKQSEPDSITAGQIIKAAPMARILKCGLGTIYVLARQGKIPKISIGKAGLRFVAKDVIEALTRQGPK